MNNPEEAPDVPKPIPWNCIEDGHEYETLGDYDPDTNSYPFLKCIHCGDEKPWEGDPDEPEPPYDA